MIVATAGHVDHGKTSLIKQLTGVDTDRLEEEKRRGLTIDLGFAYRQVNAQITLGFIDVPGHSRFINTMIAGVSAIDLGMLVIAADDGPMPQTREHLNVMGLLGVPDLIVVVSKIDRVEAARVDELVEEMRALIPGFLRAFRVSNTSGQGVAELAAWLDERALAFRQRSSRGNFRLPVDRAFTLKGVGLVVTGTTVSGRVVSGDELQVFPGGDKVRVRSLRVQDGEADCGKAGDRCALNIVGAQGAVAKGHTLATVNSLHCSRHLDAYFALLADAPFALKHLTPVKLYIGSRRLPARLYFIDKLANGRLQPGAEALVQLILEQDIACCHGDRFLIRDDSESITLGGGEVLDPAAPKAGKSRQYRLDYLAAMRNTSPPAILKALLSQSSPPVNVSSLGKSLNMTQEEVASCLEKLAVVCFESGATHYAVPESAWTKALESVCSLADSWHSENPQLKGIVVRELQKRFFSLQSGEGASELFKAVVTHLLRDARLSLAGGLITSASHQVVLSPTEQSHWEKLHQRLIQAGMKIPTVVELAVLADLEQAQVNSALESAARINRVYKINDGRFGLAENLLAHALIVAQLAECEDGLTVKSYKNKIGSGRKLAIDILEYFDGLRYTQRRDNCRIILDVSLAEKLFAR